MRLEGAKDVKSDSAAAAAFGRIGGALESKGRPIGAFATLIAPHALSLELTLVTNDTKHFARVPVLRTVNWLRGA